ncbi:MAG: endonuclease MutS2 [Gemmatimonadales bacterium]
MKGGAPSQNLAYTPPSVFTPLSLRTLEELEFAAVLECVARHAVSGLGADSVRARVPGSSVDLIRAELAAVAQLQSLLDSGDPFRPERVVDIQAIIDRLDTAGSVLEPVELTTVAGSLTSMVALGAELRRIAQTAPLAARLQAELPPSSLASDIERAIDPDGTVRDEASPELASARNHVRETRASLFRLLARHSHDLGPDGVAGDPTLKGGRYVIPVRKDCRERIRGIVHGESSSGASLFVEPAEAVDLGNELSSWESREARAVLAVLRDLTERLRPHSTLLAAGQEMCVCVDDLYARARYAIETDGHVPTIEPAPANLDIVRGFHPLILDESDGPVPFDLNLSRDERTLLLSGPNAGGKTVLLKSLGLLAAMAQAGIIPPVGRGSTIPVFARIYTDIGDHQSIAENLSTFTAHVATLRQILLQADESALILLDELGCGTDPVDGVALAGAVLQALRERKCVTVASTHLSELKELVAGADGAVNASMQFDLETLKPTYRFIKHRPGRSYGLEIARSVGLPEDVLARATELKPAQARSMDAMLAELEIREEVVSRQEQDVALEAARVERDRKTVDEDRSRIAERESELAVRERELEREGRERARRFLLDARRRVEEALGVARAAVSEATAKEARRLVEDGVRAEGAALEQLARLGRERGWRVKGAGQLDMGSPGAGSSEAFPRPTARSGSSPQSVLPEVSTEIDLRGMTADEAESALVLALDSAIAADLPWIRIIHGKGTGALRTRVGHVLQRDGRVAVFKLAPPQQGGTGVTLVEFGT